MAKKREEKKISGDLQEAISEIKEKFGEGSIMRLSEATSASVDVIPTGSVSIDIALGVMGVPRGRVIEIYGPEASGKTSLSLHILAQAQARGGVGAFIDAEHALDPDYARRIGVKVEDLLISQPDSGEQALQIVETLVRSGQVDVIVIDSVAALTPRNEIAGEMGEYQIGLQARLMSSALRKLSAIVAKTKTCVIFLNQIRMKIGVIFGCFAYDAPVLLADGSRMHIGKIVNKRLPVKVLSYNFENNKIEKMPVTDWHVNGETETFLQFFVQNHSGNGRRGFSCTPDHKIYTEQGWKKAGDLKVGDTIMVSITDEIFTHEQEQVAIGSLLGDGNIKKNNEQTGYFREEHAPKQAEYVQWLAGELGNLTSNLVMETNRGNALVETRHLLHFGDLFNLFYPEQKKIVPEQIVDTITPRAIALWYCGDGSLRQGTSEWKGKIYQRRPCADLYVNGYQDEESRERITRIFKRFQLFPRWRQCGDYKVLNFSVAEARKFFTLIAPFIPLAMQYKIPREFHGQYKESKELSRHTNRKQFLRSMKIKDIRVRVPYQDGGRISKKRFDISVAGNHNYFVDGCLVSNSPETTPGGLALKFYSSVRIELRRIAQIKHGEQITGSRVKAKIVKNKVAPPFQTAEFDIYYNEGIAYEADLVNASLRDGILQKSGSWVQFGETKIGQGLEGARAFLKENPETAERIKQQLFERARASLRSLQGQKEQP